jgi:hypothetical protein
LFSIFKKAYNSVGDEVIESTLGANAGRRLDKRMKNWLRSGLVVSYLGGNLLG